MKRQRRRAPRDGARVDRLLDLIARMAGGDLEARAPISARHDEIDALAFGLNLLGGELGHTMASLGRAREEAEQASEARAVLMRTVSHELRTPVSAILGIAELLGAPNLPEHERRRLGDRIVHNGRGLLRLVDQLLDLSSLEAQRMDLSREVLAPATVVRGVVELLEVEATRKALPVRVAVGRDAPPILVSDPVRLRQILLNLVGNAIKYTEAGFVEIRLRGPGGRAVIDVKDTGPGIVAADRARLFQPFARGGAAARRQLEGHGLGLALSRRLAQALGGDLVLKASVVGRGSTFRLTLPAPPPGMDVVARGPALAAPPARDARPLAGTRLLVVDDHDDLRSALHRLLVDAGADVEAVSDGRAALERAARGRLDLVLLDIEMPGMNGLAVASRLRARGDRTPILAATAHAGQEERERALAAGCSGVLIKPFDMETLFDEILGQLGRKRGN